MNDSSRRLFIQQILNGMLAGNMLAGVVHGDEQKAEAIGHDLPPGWHGDETIGMLIYPGFTALDLFGPHHIFSSLMGAKVLLVAKDETPVETESHIKITPTATFATCPEELTILFVPGGTLGTLAAAGDPATREFLRSRAARAQWVTSVCTGSLVLGAAGLLDGYNATSHWLVTQELALFGATPVEDRVVVDRNRMTGAGVTSGLDFALQLVQTLRGDDYARAVQLFSEYDPHPVLDCGSPAKAPAELVKLLRDTHIPFNQQVKALAKSLAK